MAKAKTKPTAAKVDDFLRKIPDDARREDCRTLLRLMQRVTKAEPKMWGPQMVGFGSYHYKYESGREGDWFVTGFSPRKDSLSVYIMAGFNDFEPLMAKLGRYKTGVSCLYVKRLADVDLKVLEQLIAASAKRIRQTYR